MRLLRLAVGCSWAEAVVRVTLGPLALLAELTMERLPGEVSLRRGFLRRAGSILFI